MGRIRWLAQQTAFERVLESAERWQRLMAKATTELQKDGEISRQVQVSASTELGAFVLAAERFQDDLRNTTAGLVGLSDHDRGQFERIVGEVSEAPQPLLLREISRSQEHVLLNAGEDGESLHLLADNGPDAKDAVVSVVGLFGMLIHPLLLILREQYEKDARPLQVLASMVEVGIPAFVRIEERGDEGAQMTYVELPMFEMAVIDRALNLLDSGDPDSAISAVLRERERALVFFGEVSAGSALIDGNGKEGLGAIPEAMLELHADLIGSEPIDYWSRVSYGYQRANIAEEKFEGVVQKGTVSDRSIKLECEGAAALTEHMTGGMVAANISPAELIESMIAQSGWEGKLRLSEEASDPHEEEFEVVTPIQGIRISEEIAIGNVFLVPRGTVALELDTTGDTAKELAAEFHRASSYAVARITTDKPHLAEDQGLAAIETALAWLVVRGRYGLAKLPDGTPQEFSRQERLRSPRLGSVVLVRGDQTERQWLRWPEGDRDKLEREISSHSSMARPALPSNLVVKDRQAILALRAAAVETDPFAQVQALWQAIESYVAGVKCRPLFSSSELEAIRSSVPDIFDTNQQNALEQAIGGLNEPPLWVKLDRQIKQDGVPITEEELDLLKRLRNARNAAVHGRSRGRPPKRDEINHGIAVVSRMLVHRIADLSG